MMVLRARQVVELGLPLERSLKTGITVHQYSWETLPVLTAIHIVLFFLATWLNFTSKPLVDRWSYMTEF